MPPIVVVVAQFGLCAAAIVFAGVRLSRYGDVIAQKSGAGGTAVGLTLLATVTSLPELVSGASAILLFDVPDIAVGNALGACLFNLLILALLDASHPVPLSARVHQGHVLAAGFVVINLGVVAASFIAGPRAPSLGWIGLSSVVMVALYALAMRTIIRFERIRLEARLDQIAEELRHRHTPMRRAVALFLLNAALLVAAAAALPGLAARFNDSRRHRDDGDRHRRVDAPRSCQTLPSVVGCNWDGRGLRPDARAARGVASECGNVPGTATFSPTPRSADSCRR